MVDVAVILINYNSSKYTLQCIDTVIAHTSTSKSYQIIVVDNNSEIEQYNLLEAKFPKQSNISLHRSIINTGFGGGNMYGAQFADSKYLLFLNNDAILLNDCVSLLIKYMDENPHVGVCTAQNYNEDNIFIPSFDHNKGLRRLLFGRSFLEKNNPKRYPKRKKEHTKPINVDWVNGAFLFFKTSSFELVGGFDTNIFLYCEEMDICHRLRQRGFESHLIPDAKILHYQSISTGISTTINKEAMLSELYVIKKIYPLWHYKVIHLYHLLILPFKPRKWYLLPVVLRGASLKHSLKQQQKVRFLPSTK